MITCDVTYSPLADIYLDFLSVDTVRSQDIFDSLPLADDPHSLFSPSPIPDTVRGCCTPPVKSLCLISLQQHVSPVLMTHNHCPYCARKLPQSTISCCSCWIWRPSPRPATSTVPATSTNSHSHLYRGNSWPANVGKPICAVGRDK